VEIDGDLLINAAKKAVLKYASNVVAIGMFDDVVARTVLELLEFAQKGYKFGPRVIRWATLKALKAEFPKFKPSELDWEPASRLRPTLELALLAARGERVQFSVTERVWLRAKLEGATLGATGRSRHVVSNAGRAVRRKLGEL